MKNKICQYCFHEFDEDKHRRTAEHIIPKGIIDLYPEQYVSLLGGKSFIDNNGMTIADVCKYCNGTLLSPLDFYGKHLINDQFYESIPADEIDNTFVKTIEYYKLSRWLLKIVYNLRRSLKQDCTWFKNALGFILNGAVVENFCFSLFAGVHINTTPLPEEAFLYFPMQINDEPKLFGSSLGIIPLGLNPLENSIRVLQASHTYCIRFGTAIFYIILWKKTVDHAIKTSYDELFENEFNFTRIIPTQTEYSLKCVSAHTNAVMGYRHLLSASAQKQDRLILEHQLGGRTPAELQMSISSDMPPDYMKQGRALVEASEFPNNTKVMRNFEKFYGKKEINKQKSENQPDKNQ